MTGSRHWSSNDLATLVKSLGCSSTVIGYSGSASSVIPLLSIRYSSSVLGNFRAEQWISLRAINTAPRGWGNSRPMWRKLLPRWVATTQKYIQTSTLVTANIDKMHSGWQQTVQKSWERLQSQQAPRKEGRPRPCSWSACWDCNRSQLFCTVCCQPPAFCQCLLYTRVLVCMYFYGSPPTLGRVSSTSLSITQYKQRVAIDHSRHGPYSSIWSIESVLISVLYFSSLGSSFLQWDEFPRPPVMYQAIQRDYRQWAMFHELFKNY